MAERHSKKWLIFFLSISDNEHTSWIVVRPLTPGKDCNVAPLGGEEPGVVSHLVPSTVSIKERKWNC